ncbi:ATP synthase subunit I [Halanaerobacter jeridensis]|uniref:ATP synthase I chain n=1 Tax=Halanaerobacter jeridensis TaxID=706427 RepID=A0A939BSD4_9FIRM|nr:ATP synthase subunit I [Halanaerobacter jeridensis]MBM7557016.1 hypothetical protein [Halanaerobacter jeridensis]
MKEVKQTTGFIVKWTLLTVVIISLFVFYFWGSKNALGIIAGSTMGVTNLYLLSFSLKKAVNFEPLVARVYMIVQYVLKYGFWFFVFYTLIKNNQINLFPTIIGMLIVKLVIFVINLFDMWPQHQNDWTG